jgi:DNA invertase Pin-like site-specific DNA recombinase
LNAVGYTRLSQDSDTSIDRQKAGIRDYCEANGFDLTEIRNDGEFSSGFDRDRTEYQAVKEAVNDGAVDAVVVYDKTRIGRDFDERMQFVLDLRATDTELHSARRGRIDLSDPTDAAVESIHAAKDDEAKREEIEKSKEAVAERLNQGFDHGRPPFGLEFDDAGERWVPGDRFDDVIKILRLRNNNATYEEIADKVGVPTTTAYRVVDRREFYVRRERLAEK